MASRPMNFADLAERVPLSRRPADVRARIEMFETVLERAWVISGLRAPVGLDSVIGLVPVAGDIVAGAIGLYLVLEARNLGLSKWTQARMLPNVGLDTALGAVPLVGDLFDFVFRSNAKNLRLIKRHLDRHHPSSATIEARRA